MRLKMPPTVSRTNSYLQMAEARGNRDDVRVCIGDDTSCRRRDTISIISEAIKSYDPFNEKAKEVIKKLKRRK